MESSQQYRSIKSFRVALLLYLVLPNIVFWVLSPYFFFARAIFNLDYVLVGVFMASLGAIPLALLLLWIMMCDVFFILLAPTGATVYDTILHIPSILHLKGLPISATLCWFLLGGLSIAFFGLLAFRITDRRTKLQLLLVGAIVAGIDIGNLFLSRESQNILSEYNFGTSNIFKIARIAIDTIREKQPTPTPLASSSSVTNLVFDFDPTAKNSVASSPLIKSKPNIVFVMVESWGVFRDESINKQVLSPIESKSLTHRYRIIRGLIPFMGATMYGEMRELCGMQIYQPSTRGISVDQCLPQILKRIGYNTLAFHNFSGSFYNRLIWYPQIGFEKSYFAESIYNGTQSLCKNTFEGLCDSDMFRFIQSKFLKSHTMHPQFIYWMTLQSHLPVNHEAAEHLPFICDSKHAEFLDTSICDITKILANVISNVAEVANSPTPRPTIFILVGDHPPPFVSKNRKNIFVENMVPYVVLVPKELENHLGKAIISRSESLKISGNHAGER